jgi:hypothetical protein
MVTLEKLIGDLLLRYNCVIIPGFGGFVAKQMAAKVDFNKGIATPPSKSLLFNRQLINNDGLLITKLAQENAFSYEEAQAIIDQQIKQWNHDMSQGNRVSIDRVGFLFLDQEKNICFEQDRYANLLLSSFGLSSLHFLTEEDVAIVQHANKEELTPTKTTLIEPAIEQAIAPAFEKEIAPAIEKEVITIGKPIQKNKIAAWKYAAAALIIPFLFYSLWIPMNTDVLESKLISFHDFNPFHKQQEASYAPITVDSSLIQFSETESIEKQIANIETTDKTYSYQLSEDAFLLVRLEQEKQETTIAPEINTSSTVVTNTASTKGINYIVGCFSEDANAQSLVAELKSKGFDAFIYDKTGGLSRVSIGQAANPEQLQEIISKATNQGYSGWILK